MTREEKLEAVEDYLLKNIGELAEILQELDTECSELFGFTVHNNTEEFFYHTFKNDPYSAVLLTSKNDMYDVEDEFIICYDYLSDIGSFSRSYPPTEFDTNLTDIAELIISARERKVIASMSNELYDMIKDL
ncbi:hypothetical protein [Bacillus phage phiAGATE]|uniref:Uncharacterized protein n=1 Tax=Bacillus phage phiAGATE TaxID=1204533 RepID=L0L8D2_9CAUD|nr:hypothetical protein G380_gp169 [Bacillus phage phiAGATE]YP_008855202.1 hypothetical protein G380_gp004 [Bacillus phage phiAGATE]AGB62654.1 hypothetical protein [Bacillus phage phiAGATE]AHB12550.1 hypothetical protein [Bacillus phage phiAGATE]